MTLIDNSRAKEKRLRRDASRQDSWENGGDSKITQGDDIDDEDLDEDNEEESSTPSKVKAASSLYAHSQTQDTSFLTNSSSIDSGAESEGELSNSSISRGDIFILVI